MTFTPKNTLDIFGLGNAIVDMVCLVEDDFVKTLGLAPGAMTLASTEQQARLLEALHDRTVKLCSGGSVANSVWTLMQSGGLASYTCKVADDPNGKFYMNEFINNGIEISTGSFTKAQEATGTCVVLTTPNAERTMSTHLGIAPQLSPEHLDMELLKRSRYVYCEGYLWSSEGSRKTCLELMKQAKRHKIPLAFSYSDMFLVNQYRDDFIKVSEEYCDVIFCNAEEARNISQEQDLQKSLDYLKTKIALLFVTDGEEGCYVCEKNTITKIPGFSVQAMDSNGAGDAFAGGVIFSLARGYKPRQAAHWGNYLASQVVCIHGSRLEKSYQNDFKKIIPSN